MHNTIDNLDPARWVATRRRPSDPTPSLFRAMRAFFGAWITRRRPHRAQPQAHQRHDELADLLVELDARTLADIGAPDHLLARALARRESQRHERDGLRIGTASGAWHDW